MHTAFFARNGRVFRLLLFLMEITRVSIHAAEFYQRMDMSILDAETTSKMYIIAMAQISPIKMGLICAVKRRQKVPLFLALPRRKPHWKFSDQMAHPCAHPLDVELKELYCITGYWLYTNVQYCADVLGRCGNAAK